MLQMTDRAAELLINLRREADLPEQAGVRVYGKSRPSGETSLAIGFSAEPMATDQVGEHAGLRLFVAPEVAMPLESAVMDVTEDEGEQELVFRPAAAQA